MFEYHGWITVLESPGEDDELMLPAQLRSRIDSLIGELQKAPGMAHLVVDNGETQIYLGGMRNHRSGPGEEVLETFGRIAEIAPGSYGLLHVWDDEDPEGRRNEFQVFVMRRGTVTRHTDTFLSPRIPMVEDEVD